MNDRRYRKNSNRSIGNTVRQSWVRCVFVGGDAPMSLDRADLFLAQEAEYELEVRSDNESICRWATETIEQAQKIQAKLEVIIDTLTNLENRDVACDVLLTPGLAEL